MTKKLKAALLSLSLSASRLCDHYARSGDRHPVGTMREKVAALRREIEAMKKLIVLALVCAVLSGCSTPKPAPSPYDRPVEIPIPN